MSEPITRNSPLDVALERLVADGTLTRDQAAAVVREAGPWPAPTAPTGSHVAAPGTERAAARPAWTTVLSEVGGYVGGAFVVAGIAVFAQSSWADMTQAARLALLGVPAVLLLVAAVVIARSTPDGWTVHERRGTTARRRLVSVLLLVVAGLGGGVAAVVNAGGHDEVAFFVTAFVLAAACYALCRGFLLHAGTIFSAAMAAGLTASALAEGRAGYSDGWEQQQQLVAGLAILAVALVWATATLVGLLDEEALGLFSSAVVAFVAGQWLVGAGEKWTWLGYLVMAALAAACFYGYVRTRQVAVLAVGVLTLATVVPQAVYDYTDGAVGAAGVLLVTGLSIVGASAAGLRLRKEVASSAAPGEPTARTPERI